MISLEEARTLWTKWIIVFTLSLVYYCILYVVAFRRQISLNATVKSRIKIADSQTRDLVRESIPLYTTENCARYASCVLSLSNSTICSAAGPIAFFYHRYWESVHSMIFGTPGLTFYISALFCGWLVTDMLTMVTVCCIYRLKLSWDVILHHILFLAVMLFMEIPIPQYLWVVGTFAYTMEVSTVFLNCKFFAKWYQCSESVVLKFKYAFLAAWMLVRAPISLVVPPIYLILFGEQMFEQYPLHKFIGALLLCLGNVVLQGIWTVLILRKAYNTFTNKKDDVTAVDNIDLDVHEDSQDTVITVEMPPQIFAQNNYGQFF